MNLVRVGLLAALLLGGSIGCNRGPKGYDLGSCSPNGFQVGHVQVVGKDLKIDLVALSPGDIRKVNSDTAVYKYVSGDSKQSHYERDVQGEKYEVMLDFEKGYGTLTVGGNPEAVILITQDNTGAKLDENAQKQFKTCQAISGASESDMGADKS